MKRIDKISKSVQKLSFFKCVECGGIQVGLAGESDRDICCGFCECGLRNIPVISVTKRRKNE